MQNNELKDGYIDLEINKYIVGFREKHKIEYEVIKELYEIFRKTQDELSKLGAFQQNVYIIASITQLYKLYQSAIILLERGLKEAANVLIRTILDLSFKIIEVIRNEDSVDAFLLEQDFETLKMLRNVKENKLFDLISEKEVDKYVGICLERTNGKNKGVNSYSSYSLAQKNGLAQEYILYRMQCEYTHQSTSVIGSIIKQNDEGYYIDANLQLEDFKTSVAWLISITTIIFPILLNEYLKNKVLSEKYQEFLENFEKNFKDLLDG